MHRCKAFAAALICGAAFVTGAQAADMPGSWLPDIKKQVFTDLISGWYMRGDIGYRMQTVGNVEGSAAPATSWSMKSVPTFGIGAGYKYKWFRSNVTLDYASRSSFMGDAAGVTGYYKMEVDSFTVLANAYLDLGEWGGFTPYIGAGIGASNIRTHDYLNPTFINSNKGQDTSRWGMSWAAMGGVAMRFTPSLLLDVSYRYLSLGDAMTGPDIVVPETTRTYLRDIKAQEIRVGLRWMLD